jgi:predicted glycogen debranching enzyme
VATATEYTTPTVTIVANHRIQDLVRPTPWHGAADSGVEPLLTREWLVTNALGGYASGTVAGVATRRYHGLLIAALPSPHGRTMMLNHIMELLRLPQLNIVQIGGHERRDGTLELYGAENLWDFRLEAGLPVWRYRAGDVVIEKRIHLVHQQNSVFVRYKMLEGEGTVRLELRPALHFRGHDERVSEPLPGPYTITAVDDRFEIADGSSRPPLRLHLYGSQCSFTLQGRNIPEMLYRIEESRGYDSVGSLWGPGHFRATLQRGGEATLVASTEPWEAVLGLRPDEAMAAEQLRRERLLAQAHPVAQEGTAAEFVLGADQFIIRPVGRVDDASRARAAGDETRTVIAGYHWFTDWGRDTMISLEGLTLVPGRHVEAGCILRTFAHYVRDGLIPNLFPEGKDEGLYHTADATLWFFHALDRYLAYTEDVLTLRHILPRLEDIVAHHLRGTRFGIGVDAHDGLLRQGAPGYQLTWMDAKVGDWVVTPRRGKAVEINALWYNALRLLEHWVRQENGDAEARPYAEHAERARASFNRRFWFASGGYLYDVIDGETGDDASCRPNQVFAISLRHPVLDSSRWEAVLRVVKERLLTPFGLRSLAPGSSDYKARYYGDLRARDAAYHQGTVWAWLIGPFVDAWLRAHPNDRAGAAAMLNGFADHLSEACVGSISEIFDAEEPFTPRGCIAQAWSVAEVLRAWVKVRREPPISNTPPGSPGGT